MMSWPKWKMSSGKDTRGTDQLARINRVWLDYYHTQQPHQGTGNNGTSSDFRRTSAGPVKRQERLSGIVAWYEREAA